jgi:signal transduction histidine kinase
LRNDEIGVAETRLADMQSELQSTLQGQKRLASLGMAVSKINHDLRNILASAQLFSDRLTALPDPTVQRLAPKLIRTIDRAVSYTQSVLSYGKAAEAPPERRLVLLKSLVNEVAEMLTLDRSSDVDFQNKVPGDLEINVDAEQLFRVLLNLARNALQPMEQDRDSTHVNRLKFAASRHGNMISILVSDTGPGVPEKARENLFEAFAGSTRPGGTGLGLAIAAEIIRAHGGEISLVSSGNPGSVFEIRLPDRAVVAQSVKTEL